MVKRARADRTQGRTGLTTAERDELARLRKENRELRTERDILKKPRHSSRRTSSKVCLDRGELRAGKEGVQWNAEQLRHIDLRWHDLRHEGACRLLADGVDIRLIQLMLGHASIQQTQRYLNVTDEELRRGLEVSWGRQLRAVSGGN